MYFIPTENINSSLAKMPCMVSSIYMYNNCSSTATKHKNSSVCPQEMLANVNEGVMRSIGNAHPSKAAVKSPRIELYYQGVECV